MIPRPDAFFRRIATAASVIFLQSETRRRAMTFAPAVSLLALSGAPAFAQSASAARDVTLKAADGTSLKGTYYASATPGPAVLLLHMRHTTRKSWGPPRPRPPRAGGA